MQSITCLSRLNVKTCQYVWHYHALCFEIKRKEGIFSMPENTDRPVTVTGYEERPHPALRKLARACLALARHLRDSRELPTATTAGDQPEPGTEARP